MTAQPNSYITEDDYLQQERASVQKHEYVAGRIYALAGASETRNLLALNIAALLRAHTRGRSCRAYPSDMRVKIAQTGLYTYPDFSIVCGEAQFLHPDKRDTLLNPVGIIEMLSPSTERYDRGEKFQHYRTLASLQEYLLVAQHTYRVEHFVRHSDHGWLLSDVVGREGKVTIRALQASLALAAIYEDVVFATDAPGLREE